MPSRRRTLALGATLSTTALAGCTALRSEPEYLTLHFLNFDSEPHTIAVEMLRADADQHSDAVVLREQYELGTPPEDRTAEQHTEADLLESDRYLVRVHLDNAPATRAAYQYYPDCEASERTDDVLFIEARTERETGDRYIEFKQSRCTHSPGWF
ncbi:uncharacterized protein Nmag_2581 [Natrialba magadii ATCC 43099]|uniref:Lipoprotein n=1 Tax=Natrialba magadii (strain ATCC 43099 / DSM 3394 / CCM 3739 / CIP 104546 / IAM 13178 / JCM 8861 / NBRC 102185 / NCIMB 2190 / MS3) TaxID=547559 RepID=D3SYG9_NATMM|nr:hypothetical protein [Natrialba magadii]ADD06140.1 uncharacterized protein Nmag_2581 [Natrialba magadii ATCC 43099]ELY30861.1 hypothetical protein C500_07483 [Natrialba magadii ATCC 43099]